MPTAYRDLLTLIRKNMPPLTPLVFALVLALLETGAALFVPKITGDLLDGMKEHGIQTSVVLLLASMLLAQAIAGAVSHYLLGYAGQRVVARLRNTLFGRLLNLPVPFYDDNTSGEMASRVINDTTSIRELVTEQVVYFISGLAMIVGSIIIMWVLDWKMTLTLFGCVVFALLVIIPIARKLHEIAKQLQDETASFTDSLTRVFGEIRLVKAYGAEQREREVGKTAVDKLFRLRMRETKIQAVMSPFMTLAMMGALVAILGYGGARTATGELGIGELVAFILYLFNIITPMVQLTFFFTALNTASGAAERMIGLLGETEEDPDGLPVPSEDHNIYLQDVHFAYGEDKDPVLQGVDLTFEANRITALVGPSGSGKSTLFALLERFYRPTSGKILLGDQPVSDFHLQQYRDLMGYVSQEAPLLAGTIRENICYGLERPVTDEELHRAAEQAYARDFIEAMPDGYETQVGERGVKLSGGQRQRIAIARALLKDPRILMLDEATSSLDSESEQMVQKALNNLMKNRTTLVIAHRLSTVVDAHRIAVLEDGRVTAAGSHRELTAESPLYRKLVAQQFKQPQAEVKQAQTEAKQEEGVSA